MPPCRFSIAGVTSRRKRAARRRRSNRTHPVEASSPAARAAGTELRRNARSVGMMASSHARARSSARSSFGSLPWASNRASCAVVFVVVAVRSAARVWLHELMSSPISRHSQETGDRRPPPRPTRSVLTKAWIHDLHSTCQLYWRRGRPEYQYLSLVAVGLAPSILW